jgi:hypothetical protein
MIYTTTFGMFRGPIVIRIGTSIAFPIEAVRMETEPEAACRTAETVRGMGIIPHKAAVTAPGRVFQTASQTILVLLMAFPMARRMGANGNV